MPRSKLRDRPWLRAGALMTVLLLLAGSWVAADALSAPGADPPAAKLAEWARDHRLGGLVSTLEGWQYQLDPPSVGGLPDGGIPRADGAVPPPALPTRPLAPLARGAPLPGEGAWQTVIAVRDRPAVQVSYLRPDDQHTSFLAGVLRMDPALVRGQLRPGTRDPGGQWPEATSLTGPETAGVVAAFNSGFRLNDSSRPGYVSGDRTVNPLVNGQASLVLYRDGHADVGAWNADVRMSPDVLSVRQNLVPLVANGQVNTQCGRYGIWGGTVGTSAFVDRSGFGVTADGHEVYVGGPALSVCTLGAVLADAGVVRGMELDINPAWVSGAYFTRAASGPAVAHRLYPAEKVAPQHYLAVSSRDWFAWFLR